MTSHDNVTDIERRLDDLDGSDFSKVREHSEALRSYVATLRKQLENAREALDEAVKICEEELVPIYEDSPNETDSVCNELVRHIANNIRALKGQPC